MYRVLAIALLTTACGGGAKKTAVTSPPPPDTKETRGLEQPKAPPPDDDAKGGTSSTANGGTKTAGADPCEGGEIFLGDNKKAAPHIAAGAGPVAGQMSASEISSVIKRNAKQFKNCYLTELAKKPDLKGRVVAQFTIGRDGKVTRASASGIDPEVEACVQRVVETLTFTPTGSESRVSFPFIFSSAN